MEQRTIGKKRKKKDLQKPRSIFGKKGIARKGTQKEAKREKTEGTLKKGRD